MPSPFSGMDPYLENPDLWQGFHNSLMTYIRNELAQVLPHPYVPILEARIYIDLPELQERRADIEIIRTPATSGVRTAPAPVAVESGGYWIERRTVERREAYVAIRRMPERRHVTTIEVLSLTNKRPGPGRSTYVKKQDEIIRAGVNLVEIDLLRSGRHTILADEERLIELAPLHYVASVYRVTNPARLQVFPWTLRDPLPRIPIPLLEEDSESELDLQSAFARNYEDGAFARILDYTIEPEPLLAPEDAVWADELLRAAGFRSGADA